MAVEIEVKTRSKAKADYLRSYKIRQPDADVGPGTQPDIDASVIADQLVPVYAAAQATSRAILLKNTTGDALDERGEERGVFRNAAQGSGGFVIVDAASTGGTIFDGDELTDPDDGTRYRCAATALYADGDLCPVVGIDTGPSTDRDAGAILQWSSPRPGIGPTATVYEQSDGSGLTGGANREEDDEYRARIYEEERNPPASGNDAEYAKVAGETPGIAIEKVFTYPAILGPGTIALVFTLRTDDAHSGRIPNATQIAEVEAYVVGRFPADDGAFFCTILAQSVNIALEVEWADGAPGWVDTVPWPPRYEAAGSPGKIVIGSVTDATHFTLQTANADYTGVVQPVAGNTIAVYDQVARKFRRKKFLSVTGTGPWTIVCDTAENASDTSYTPVGSQPVCPWSDSLDQLVEPVHAYFKKLGPGEQVAVPFDAGLRQRRQPKPPREWPNVISNRLLDGVFDLEHVNDATLAEGLGTATTTGTPGVSSYLMTLGYLTAFEG